MNELGYAPIKLYKDKQQTESDCLALLCIIHPKAGLCHHMPLIVLVSQLKKQ